MMQIQRRASIIFAIACFALLIGLLALAVQQARDAARRMHSGNNLKQIGLGLLNFESAMKRLPAGCDGEAKHGWMTRIQPYMEASSWYSTIHFDQAWDHPCNEYKFFGRLFWCERPNVASSFTEEGYGLTHYLANPGILHRGSKVRFSEIEAGLANTWFVGEVSGKYQPFGYPYNWRALTWPLNDGNGGYGGWSDGAQICMGDGLVRFVSAKIDKGIVERLALSMPSPSSDAIETPNKTFAYMRKFKFRKTLSFPNGSQGRSKGESCSDIFFDLNDNPDVAVFVPPRESASMAGISLEAIFKDFPGIKILDYHKILDDDGAELIAKFSKLETLIVGALTVTDIGVQRLATLPRLKNICCSDNNGEAIEKLKSVLPHCEVAFVK